MQVVRLASSLCNLAQLDCSRLISTLNIVFLNGIWVASSPPVSPMERRYACHLRCLDSLLHLAWGQCKHHTRCSTFYRSGEILLEGGWFFFEFNDGLQLVKEIESHHALFIECTCYISNWILNWRCTCPFNLINSFKKNT